MTEIPMNLAELRTQAHEMRLHGLLAHWSEVMADAQAAQRVQALEDGQRLLGRPVRWQRRWRGAWRAHGLLLAGLPERCPARAASRS